MAIKHKNINLLGAFLSVAILLLCILIFIFRMCNYPKTEYWLGVFLLLTFFPLVYLLIKAKQVNRPPIYFIQIGLMICFLIVELFLEYIFIFPFREVKWMTINYIILFFAGTGGMIGVASNAGKNWSIISVILFLNMTALAFMQHIKTGM